MQTLVFPLTFGSNGRAAVYDSSQRVFFDQVIALTVRIEPGELPLDPGFGTVDPTFDTGEPNGLRSSLAQYWPQIRVSAIERFDISDSGNVSIFVDYTTED